MPESASTSSASRAPAAPPAAPATRGERSYAQILKSSVLIGGATAFNVVIGVARTKAMALLLGPAGFGLMGLYWSIASLAQTVAGMGVNNSGVRQIAAALGSGDAAGIARTAAVLRRAALVLGLLGAAGLVLLARPVARLTFGSDERAGPVALLALAVLFRVASDGQAALIQGLRRIADLARITVLGSLSGSAVGVGLVYLYGEQGIVPALAAIAGGTLFFAWWFGRRVRFERPALSFAQVSQETGALLKLGFAFMASGLLTMGAAYAVRLMVAREVGFTAAGLYHSAWTIGGLYVSFILQAMGADFYPRLTGVIRDRAECNRLVNEQAEVSLLLAAPGILATLTFAPLVIALFYSSAFGDAVAVLRWICLGATLQVVTWPLGFIIVAEGRQSVFFWSEVAYTAAHLGAAWLLVRHAGVDGAGTAFFLSYVFHGCLVYPLVRWLTGFRWSAANRRRVLALFALIGGVFAGVHVLPFALATTLGALAAVGSGVYSARVLVHLVSPERVPRVLRRVLVLTRVVPRGTFGGG